MLARERRAVAAAIFAAYGLLLGLLTLADTPFRAFLGTMAATYALGFFGLVAGYFWARWLARGIALSGALTATTFVFMGGPDPVTIGLALTHGLAALALSGRGIAALFDGRPEWREAFSIDDQGARRIGVIFENLGLTMPFAAYYAFFPRGGALVAELGAGVGLALVALGIVGLSRMRTWGWLAGVAGAITFASGLFAAGRVAEGVFAAGVAALIASPLARPAVRFVRG